MPPKYSPTLEVLSTHWQLKAYLIPTPPVTLQFVWHLGRCGTVCSLT